MINDKDTTEDNMLMAEQSSMLLWEKLNNYKFTTEPFKLGGIHNPSPFFVACKGENMELMWNRTTYSSYLLNNDEKKAWVLRTWNKLIPIFNGCVVDHASFRKHNISIDFETSEFLDWWGFYVGNYEDGVAPILWMINSVCVMTFIDKFSNVLLPLEAISEEERPNWIRENHPKAVLSIAKPD